MGIKLEDLAHLCLIFSWEYQGSCNRLSGKLHCPLGAGLRVSACFPLIKCGPKPVPKQLSLLKGISSSREFCVKYTAIKLELRSHQPCLYQRSYNWMSMGWLRVRHDWATSLSLFTFSCLENPREGGAWWAAVYGVAQSWTQLKWLSSR